jgi:hypothetical protein
VLDLDRRDLPGRAAAVLQGARDTELLSNLAEMWTQAEHLRKADWYASPQAPDHLIDPSIGHFWVGFTATDLAGILARHAALYRGLVAALRASTVAPAGEGENAPRVLKAAQV